MDSPEAAQRLGVAEAEVVDVKAEAGWWHALHHDMASHDENWRRVVPVVDDDAAVADEPASEPADAAADTPVQSRRKTR
jgi:dihydropteroate synthase